MVNCENCIHYDVCIKNKAFDDYHFDSCDEKVNELGCSDFKDKSKIVELPCKVGDTVYYPWKYDGASGVACNEVESIKIYVNKIPLVFVRDWESDMPMPTAFYPENFGKTVFTTYEEAKKALERSNGDGK